LGGNKATPGGKRCREPRRKRRAAIGGNCVFVGVVTRVPYKEGFGFFMGGRKIKSLWSGWTRKNLFYPDLSRNIPGYIIVSATFLE